MKRKRIRACLRKGKVDIAFFQETKLKATTDVLESSLWGEDNFEWSAQNSEGLSGGLLIIWKNHLFCPIFSFRGVGYLGVCAYFKGIICYFVNVYSPCALVQKRRLWAKLLSLRNLWRDGVWCLGGDFNAVKNEFERIGRNRFHSHQESTDFNDFIGLMDMDDLPIGHIKFSWSRGSDGVMSRIDRFLLSSGFVSLVSATSQVIEEKDVSDHSHVWL